MSPQKKDSKRFGKRYSRVVWQTIRSAYETYGTSLRKLSEKYGPHETAIARVKKIEKWRKGYIADEAAAEARSQLKESMADLFERVGMPTETVARKVVAGIQLGEMTRASVVRALSGDGANPLSLEFLQLVNRMYDEFRCSLEYVKEYNKMAGTYTPRAPVDADGKTVIPATIYLPDNGRGVKDEG